MRSSCFEDKLVSFVALLNRDERAEFIRFLSRPSASHLIRDLAEFIDAGRSIITGDAHHDGPRSWRPESRASYDEMVALVIDMLDRMAISNMQFSDMARQYFGISMARVAKKSRDDLKGDLAMALLRTDHHRLHELVERLSAVDAVPQEPSEIERWFDLITGSAPQ